LPSAAYLSVLDNGSLGTQVLNEMFQATKRYIDFARQEKKIEIENNNVRTGSNTFG
jgi:hypothetical protein